MDEDHAKKRKRDEEGGDGDASETKADDAEKSATGNTAEDGNDNQEGERQQQQQDKQQSKNNITIEGEQPKKKFYRQRAHCNPLSHNDSFEYPISPDLIDWSKEHYPNLSLADNDRDTDKSDATTNTKVIRPNVLDIGCGFGGLTLALATLLPKDIILGCEIRAKVTEYVRLRIVAARQEHASVNNGYQNCSVLRTNTMKFLVNYFYKSSIDKIFICFPDPHFKRKNHSRRIVSQRLLSEYAYVLKPNTNSRLYCITDVNELHEWHVAQCDSHPLFRRITDEALLKQDPCVQAMYTETEEGKKVDREKRNKYYCVYERIPNEQATSVHAGNFFV